MAQPISDGAKTIIDSMAPVSNGNGYSIATILRNLFSAMSSLSAAKPASQRAVGANESAFDGLSFAYQSGTLHNLGGSKIDLTGSLVALSDATTNYVEMDPQTGEITKNTEGFTAGAIPLFAVDTVDGEITSVADKRARMVALTAAESIAGADFSRALARKMGIAPTWTVGDESDDVIEVSFTLDDPFADAPDAHGDALTMELWLADSVNGWESSTPPDTGFTVETGVELKAASSVRKIVKNTEEASGPTIAIDHSGTKTWYMGVAINGLVFYSPAITFE